MSSPTPHLPSALIAGRFAIRRKLGAGGMGTVYLAHDEAADRLVALKVLRAERLTLDAARLQEEFRRVARLRHPRIAAAHDFGYAASGTPYYTREYVRGQPLPAGPPGNQLPRRFLQPILDLLDALRYLHAHDLLHLDIHPGNLIVAEDEERGSVLIDVGLLPSSQEPRLATSAGAWPPLPPEILRGEPTARSDLYLAGRLLQFRLTGHHQGEPRLPREIPGWGTRLTLELERILVKALQPSPDARFQSALEFRDALAGALGERAAGPQPIETEEALAGREREISALEAALEAAAGGRAALLCFAGEPGLGKTRLLAEARIRAQLRGLDTGSAAFFPDPGPEPALTAALRALRPAPDWLEPLRPRHGGSPAERARRAAQAFFAEKGRPLVLLIDDLEAADAESAALVHALAVECAGRSAAAQPSRGLALIAAGVEAPAGIPGRHVRVLKPLGLRHAQSVLRDLLRPLAAPASVLRRAAREGQGSPLRLRLFASRLRAEWESAGAIPDGAEVQPIGPGTRIDVGGSAIERAVLAALVLFARPAPAEELAFVLELDARQVGRALHHLERAGAVSGRGRGAARRYQAAQGEEVREALRAAGGWIGGRRGRALHRRAAGRLQGLVRRGPRDEENLARHLLAAGRRREGVNAALGAAALLRKHGSFDRAARLLESAVRVEKSGAGRLQLIAELSSLREESGDHGSAIALLEPLLRARGARLSARDAVGVRRRLGVHYHRAGMPEKALAVFAAALAAADEARDLKDLIFIDSELAELHTFRGSYAEAEAAARRGLERTARLKPEDEFRGRMAVVLRASLGHVALRRMALEPAREEFVQALKLARRFARDADRAVILHNLAITENQLNDFTSARRRFLAAERLLLRTGDRNVIKIATNLAVIAAKLGDHDEAERHIERARQLLRRLPDARLECFAAYAQGTVAHLAGETPAAISAFTRAIALARSLGDEYLAGFAAAHLAEARIFAGCYRQALRDLQALARRVEKDGPPVLRRMAASRLAFLGAVLGRTRGERPAGTAGAPRTGIALLEAWNDLFLGLGAVLRGESGTVLFTGALATFTRLRTPAGARFARLGLLLAELPAGRGAMLRKRVAEIEDPPSLPGGAREGGGERHRFLAVAEPLAAAEALFRLGDREGIEARLSRASAAIVGCPFLELDWMIEFLRARAALQAQDVPGARRHIHRSLHMRDHLLQLVPPAARRTFTAHARFAALEAAAARLERPAPVEHSTAHLRLSSRYEEMVGRSPAMLRLFQTIERLRDQEVPVLIRGETGSGKELVARAIHRRSPRGQGPFLAIHCASLLPELFASEFFGYEAGAFTGAESEQPGLLESLAGGTLLLDDLEDLPRECQAKLLQVFESRAVRRLGGAAARPVDVRFLAATSTDLAAAAAAGTFRADLFHRIRRLEIAVPPLREREGDVALLARHFLAEHGSRLGREAPEIDGGALALLAGYSWPGNVRELETVVLRALLETAAPGPLGARDLAPLLAGRPPPALPKDLLERSLDAWRAELEREYIQRLFARSGGDPRPVMAALGVKRTKLYAWLRKLGMDVRELRGR